MLRKSRSLRRSWLTLLALLLALTTLQLGPLASAASAFEELMLCSPKYAERDIALGNGVVGREKCLPVYMGVDGDIWDWVPISVGPGNNRRTDWVGKRTSPPYIMSLTALMGEGPDGGGAGHSKVMIYTADHKALQRTIASRVVIQKYSSVGGWFGCRDSGWKQASVAQHVMRATINQYREPDCGNGDYRALASGRFWSVSLNRWETRGWVYSPAITLDIGTLTEPTEPTYSLTPTPDSPDD